ncbi:hypothetical protein GTW51_18965 [Aurantimonas aggregata]|uniref:Uncharacterized protein n=1 Tax=Aurantimonas aggregata TaxID=2047720 RepID=A0A6L9MMN4_9HYPH|nr:hypothetical protein [Aurantimonas aggregata]NDV88780.1 hypothetical protein [Aurantimonas aggregata]
MNSLVHIEPGQWVLAYKEGYGPFPGSGELREALDRLVYEGSGWTCLNRPADQFDVLHVARVMPKTFTVLDEPGRRFRDQVVAAASTEGEIVALRDKLFGIGVAADRAIEEETARVMAEFARKTRADGLAKIHRALPHIFGREA